MHREEEQTVRSREQPKPGSYQPRTALEKHCAFFDLDGDGQLTVGDTFAALRQLGYGLILSVLGTLIVHFFLSYPTLDTWIPDPLFTVHLKNIHRCKHGSDSDVYDERGEMQKERADYLLNMFAVPTSSPEGAVGGATDGIGLVEGARMIYHNRNAWDLFGWCASIVEWSFMWSLCADHQGRVSREAVLRQYDGTLFYEIAAKRQKEQLQHDRGAKVQ